MKIKAFMAISADGFIANSKDEVSWSEDHWRNYFEICQNVKNLIVGRRSFELMEKEGEFDKLELDNCFVVSRKVAASKVPFIHFSSSPRDVVDRLKSLSVSEAILGGGTSLLRSFLSEQLIDELILEVEPIILGSGYPLFGELAEQQALTLQDSFKSGKNTVRLQYAINYR